MTRTPTAGVDARAIADRLRHDGDVRILDVRTPAEYESAHIPGSYNVPLDTLTGHAQELRRHVDQPVVLVRQSGDRAARAGQRPPAGMANVTVLDGGMRAWHPTGAPVDRGHQRRSPERQVAELIDASTSRDA